MCLCAWMCKGFQRAEGRDVESPELELQAIEGHRIWMLGTKLGSSARTKSALDC